MRKLDELHLRHPFKGSRRLRDDLWDEHGLHVNRKRVQCLIQIMAMRTLAPDQVYYDLPSGLPKAA